MHFALSTIFGRKQIFFLSVFFHNIFSNSKLLIWIIQPKELPLFEFENKKVKLRPRYFIHKLMFFGIFIIYLKYI